MFRVFLNNKTTVMYFTLTTKSKKFKNNFETQDTYTAYGVKIFILKILKILKSCPTSRFLSFVRNIDTIETKIVQ